MRTVQRSALCRSWRELSNESFLAKFGFDAAENEPSQVRKFELLGILNLNFEISKLLFAAQAAFGLGSMGIVADFFTFSPERTWAVI